MKVQREDLRFIRHEGDVELFEGLQPSEQGLALAETSEEVLRAVGREKYMGCLVAFWTVLKIVNEMLDRL